jgi:hypothetical protein
MLTHHSVAWETLLAKDADRRDECNGCHVTGKGNGGWEHERSALVDVGCESCHGPGGPHDGRSDDPRASCVVCHDKKHSIAFTVEKGIPHLDHFRSAGMSEAAFLEAFRSLHTGQKERPLLAFQEGPHVGTQTCVGCHPTEHAWWKQDKHANAMASLSGLTPEGRPARDEAACVRCHASPKTHGIAQQVAISSFVPAEGVGCESCHGPGGAHVAAGGGKDNIEGLGDDCPVCVLEALCTSCHTAIWDPGWNLDLRLNQIRHGPP